ncbi:serpin family protein [Mongoliitalea daihaiensis]|nr:serpin family protein [Mongoliitalea daihaiensis]
MKPDFKNLPFSVTFLAKCTVMLLIILVVGCLPGEPPLPGRVEPNLRVLSASEEKLSESSTQFAINLFQQLNQSNEAKNQFFSPYSIHQALAMTMNGNEGEVKQEFLDVLQMQGMSLEDANQAVKDLTTFLLQVDEKVKLNIANGIWYKEGYQVKPPFKAAANRYFNAEVAPLDMLNPNSVNVINNWIARQTNNLIREMLDQIPPNAVMYLVNAIYFKGDWTYNFPKANTKKEKFTLRNGQDIMVDMMDLKDASDMRYGFGHGAAYLEIPYSSEQYSMGVIFNESGDLSQLAPLLTLENLTEWRSNARERGVILKMPKFKISYKMDNMKGDLMAMGLVRPFSFHPDNFTALFSNPTDDLKISRVIHQAFIEVDEKGTEAAAATIVEVVERFSAGPSGPLRITLDRPFIFFIQEKHSGAILFMGKLENPLEG